MKTFDLGPFPVQDTVSELVCNDDPLYVIGQIYIVRDDRLPALYHKKAFAAVLRRSHGLWIHKEPHSCGKSDRIRLVIFFLYPADCAADDLSGHEVTSLLICRENSSIGRCGAGSAVAAYGRQGEGIQNGRKGNGSIVEV